MLSISNNMTFANMAANQAEAFGQSLEKLSSGLRINHASDDAAGLQIADNLTSQVRGDAQAAQNCQEAIRIMNIAQDGTAGITPILQRMRELIVQSANDTNTPKDKQDIQAELDSIRNSVCDAYLVARNARIDLNGANPINRILTFQVGANQGQEIKVDFNPLRNVLGPAILSMFGYTELYNSPYKSILDAWMPPPGAPPPTPALQAAFPKKLDVTVDHPTTDNALNFVQSTIDGVDGQLAYLGAMTNQIAQQYQDVQQSGQDQDQAESQIRDVDMADETVTMARANILRQSSLAVLAQSNFTPTTLMSLFK
ncbi:MAG TPA: flagellin [Oscillatoriaceae cyanobacterium]